MISFERVDYVRAMAYRTHYLPGPLFLVPGAAGQAVISCKVRNLKDRSGCRPEKSSSPRLFSRFPADQKGETLIYRMVKCSGVHNSYYI